MCVFFTCCSCRSCLAALAASDAAAARCSFAVRSTCMRCTCKGGEEAKERCGRHTWQVAAMEVKLSAACKYLALSVQLLELDVRRQGIPFRLQLDDVNRRAQRILQGKGNTTFNTSITAVLQRCNCTIRNSTTAQEFRTALAF